jgi:subtilisin family serine protease
MYLKTGTINVKPSISETFYFDSLDSELSAYERQYFVLISFNEIPGIELQKELSKSMALVQYMPDNSYYATIKPDIKAIQLREFQIADIQVVKPEWKLDVRLKNPESLDWIWVNGKMQIELHYYKSLNIENYKTYLNAQGLRVIHHNNLSGSFRVEASKEQLNQVLQIPFVYWVEPVPAPVKTDNWVERTNHRVPSVEKGSSPLGLSGKGVIMGEWDGTGVGPHIDFDFRLTRMETFTNNSNGNHATHVAGTMAGGGILNAEAKGMASQASIFSWDFNGWIPGEMDTAAKYQKIEITQNSYTYSSDPCSVRGTYDVTSASIDQLVNKYPHLLHVFAAGNSRSSNCIAGGYRTVFSGFQAAKNNLTVAAVTNLDANSSFHSYGPTMDGRLKPEVSAVGVNVYSTFPYDNYMGGYSGTSMACPGTSGTAALIYELYEKTYKKQPPAHLIKGIMCNGADELGNPGPDFQFGFGRINARRSANILSKRQFKIKAVGPSGVSIDTIFIPARQTELKVFLCWDDPNGSASSAKSLVNNLDLELIDSSGNLIKPWRLNPAVPSDNAIRANDTLNNYEQVTISNPTSPYYLIKVRGTVVVAGIQNFSINWMWQDSNITITYPNGGEKWMPPSSTTYEQIIRWDSYKLTGNAKIDYSLDSGATWKPVVAATPVINKYYVWNNSPDSLKSRRALIKITVGGLQDLSDNVFNIFKIPAKPTGMVCDSQVNLTWVALANAVGYKVYMHDSGLMKEIAFTNGTEFTVRNLQNDVVYWFAISAIGPDGAESERSLASKFTPVSAIKPPRFTSQPSDSRVCTGGNTNFDVQLSGNAVITSWWEQSLNNGLTWQKVGINNLLKLDILNVNTSQNNRLFRHYASNSCLSKEYSREARLQVDSGINFSYLYNKVALCLGQDSAIELKYTGPNKPTINWYYKINLTGTPVLKTTNQDWIRVTNVMETDEGYYYAEITDACGKRTSPVTPFLEVRPPLTLNIPKNDTLCQGQTFSLNATASGGDSTRYFFIWRDNNSSSVGSLKVIQPNVDQLWEAVLFDNCSPDSIKKQVRLWMREPLSISVSNDTTICKGNTIELLAKVKGGRSNGYHYYWSGGLPDKNKHFVTPMTTTAYNLTFTDSCSTKIFNESIVVTVRDSLKVNIVGPDTVCFGTPVVYVAISDGGLSSGYKFQWNSILGTNLLGITPKSSQKLTLRLSDGCTVADALDSLYVFTFDSLKMNVAFNGTTICKGQESVLNINPQGGNPLARKIVWSNGILNASTITVKPDNTTTYSVSLSDGCSTPNLSESIKVNVRPPLSLNAGNDFRACTSSLLDLKLVSGGGLSSGYKYTMNGILISGSEVQKKPDGSEGDTDTYYFRLEDGCTVEPAFDTLKVAIDKVQSDFNIRIPVDKTTAFISSVTLNEVQYLFGDGRVLVPAGPKVEHTFKEYGRYQVCRIETSDIGCADTSCQNIEIIDVFTTSDFEISVYPNPVKDLLNVRFDKLAGDLKLELFSTEGKQLFTQDFINYTQKDFFIDFSHLAHATYFLKVTANGEVKTVEVVKGR